MIAKWRWIAVFELLVIAVLAAALINSYSKNSKSESQLQEDGLVSPRVYAKVIDAKSLLITNFVPLKQEILDYAGKSKVNVSVYLVNLRNGVSMGIEEKAEFFPASLNKLPIAISIMKKVENGELGLDTMLPIEEPDKAENFELYYKNHEKEAPVSILLEKMLRFSDNTAFNVLLHELSDNEVKFILDYYGFLIKSEKGIQNYVTPKQMYNLFSSLYLSTVLESKNSEYILSLLTNTILNMNLIADVPADVTIAHKFGDLFLNSKLFFHDCGIMYINKSRIFYCVMTEDLPEKNAIIATGFIVNKIYNYVKDAGEKLDIYREK